jgi:hypothetical protein
MGLNLGISRGIYLNVHCPPLKDSLRIFIKIQGITIWRCKILEMKTERKGELTSVL